MRLFEIDNDTYEIRLNKPWIGLVPEFAAILKRDRGSPGDSKGEKKVRARKEFTFIYFFCDFGSPIRDWEDAERRKEALYYAGLTEKDIKDDKVVATAIDRYQELLLKGSRSIRTYRSLLKTLDALDEYFELLDFKSKDKKGELLNAPEKVAMSIERMDKVYTAVKNFEKRVDEELKNEGTGIRGTATLGDNEDRKKEWSESDIAAGSQHAAGTVEDKATFTGLLHILQDQTKKERAEEEIETEE